MVKFFTALTTTLFLGACLSHSIIDARTGDSQAAPTTYRYTPPNRSGLRAVRPYPRSDDVCVLLRKNNLLTPYFEAGYELVACPKHEFGAIGDRQCEGARVVAYAKHWTVLQTTKAVNE